MFDQRREPRETLTQLAEHALEVAFQRTHGSRPRGLGLLARISPRGELALYNLLDRFAGGEIRRATVTAADEIDLVERERCGEHGKFDQPADALRCVRRDAKPIPTALDDLAVGADGNAA